MRKTLFIPAIVSVLCSCAIKNGTKEIDCVVTKSEAIPKKSIHDEMNPTKYMIETDCGKFFSSRENYQVGDTVKMTIVYYK
jgi:hypothetical protein